MNKLIRLIKNKEILLVLGLLVVSGLAHGINMFNFPYFENDEGTYMAQAWSLINTGELAPYTYWYDHAPLGWTLIAIWTKLTGGFFTFGVSMNSGRVFMLVIHLASSLLLYYIVKRLSGKRIVASLSVLIFSLSPLAIYFQRRVLLDNIMTFWILASLSVLLKEKLKLRHIIFSAAFFAMGVLTKENAIVLGPAYLYVLYLRAHAVHKSFAYSSWLSLSALLIFSYPLYALLNNEFFPVGFMGNDEPHVSLITSLQAQLERGASVAFWHPASNFYVSFSEWFRRDSFLVYAGSVATAIIVIKSVKNKILRIPAAFTVLFLLFLIKGGLIINFYVVPLIPFLATNIALAANFVVESIAKDSKFRYQLLYSAIGLTIVYAYIAFPIEQYTLNETSAQKQAITWVRENLPKDSYVIIDNYAYLDIRSSGGFENADWYFKVLYDPEITQKFGRNLQRSEYILLSHNIVNDFRLLEDNFIEPIFKNAEKINSWEPAETTHLNIEYYISTYGDWATLYKVVDEPADILARSWDFYKKSFINEEGSTFDPTSANPITSEAQSYTLLRAVFANDRKQFDETWEWTRNNLQLPSKLFRWNWAKDISGIERDLGTASDADTDIALALLFAEKRWGGGNYLNEAKQIIDAIWKFEVKILAGKPYLVAGDWAKREPVAVINPSYLSPYAYRIFSEVDPGHDWMKLVDTSYEALYACSSSSLDKESAVGLPPDWCAIARDGSAVVAPIVNRDSTDYSYDAIRTLWKLAVDYKWNNEPRAKKFVEANDYLLNEWKENDKVSVSYTHDGLPINSLESSASYGANIGYYLLKDEATADEVYNKKLLGNLTQVNGSAYWDEPGNYYTQNWAWFGTALYSDKLPNLWVEGL